jgi:hypothetical protein
MADQAERVILEAEETPVLESVGRANTALDSFEKKSESSHGKVIRISDQTRTSVQRLIASLEKQAETYGKSGVDKLISQRDQLLQRYSREPQAIDAITKSYERMVAEQKKIESEAKFEGFGEKIKQFIESPLAGAKNAVTSLLTAMGPFGGAIAAGVTVLTGIALAGFEAAKSLGEYGVRIRDVELRTGLTAKEVGQFGFAARGGPGHHDLRTNDARTVGGSRRHLEGRRESPHYFATDRRHHGGRAHGRAKADSAGAGRDRRGSE